MNYIKEKFEEAQKEARKFAIKEEGENVMIFPCGFAWIYHKTRKNNKFGKELEQSGLFEWDPYYKRYYYWVGEYNQSMDHKYAHAKKLAEILTYELAAPFYASSRMD